MKSGVSRHSCWLIFYSFFLIGNCGSVHAQVESSAVLNLEFAITQANANDLWIKSNEQSQAAVEAQAISMGTLPDPKMMVAFANLPTDSFEFNQEPMTQFKVEVSQMFPRGDIRELKQIEKEIQSAQFPLLRADRSAKVRRAVSILWLDGFKAQNTIHLIEQDRALFEQLVDVAQAAYASTARRTRQQDIVRAQLELTQLEDRLTKLHMQQDATKQQLSEWLPSNLLQRQFPTQLPNQLPNVLSNQLQTMGSEDIVNELETPATNASANTDLTNTLLKHPLVLALEKQIAVADTGIKLAKQTYKPEWGVMASYAYRDDAPNGLERSDFFSLGVSFDLPLFTGNRQDKQVSAATSNTEAKKTQKLLLLKEMMAQVATLQVTYQRNRERQNLYQEQLLPQIHEQAEAALTAYTNDDGDFAEVMRARIAELNASIEMLNIEVEQQKIIAQLHYFYAGHDVAAAQ